MKGEFYVKKEDFLPHLKKGERNNYEIIIFILYYLYKYIRKR